MDYPKEVMSISEMTKLGIAKTELICNVNIPGQKFAWKTSGGGKWLIDTAAYEKWRQSR